MKLSKETIVTVVVLLLVVGAVGTYSYRVQEVSRQESTSAASALSTKASSQYTTLAGEPLDLRQFDGQVRVVNSWASWCPFCVDELPDLSTLASEYQEQGVVVIAINRKEDPRLVEAYLNSRVEAPNVVFALDSTDSFYETIGGFSMPETVFYDRNGNVAFHKRGFMGIEEMRTHVETALNAETE